MAYEKRMEKPTGMIDLESQFLGLDIRCRTHMETGEVDEGVSSDSLSVTVAIKVVFLCTGDRIAFVNHKSIKYSHS